jgi:hypothetical protein
MSASRVREDHPDNGSKPSHSDTTESTLQLSKMILNQNQISALDVGGQQSKGFNVFVLSPTQLKDIGLVVKMNNGKPTIIRENKDGSTAKVLSTSHLVPLLQTPKISPETVAPDRMNATDSGLHQEVEGISLKSQSCRGSTVVRENKEKSLQCLKVSTGVKRKRLDENDGYMQKGLDKVRLLVNTFRPIWKVLCPVCCSNRFHSLSDNCRGALLSVT